MKFIGEVIEHCKGTLGAKVHIKRLEDLAPETAERAVKDLNFSLLKQSLSALGACHSSLSEIDRILASEVATAPMDGNTDFDPVAGIFDLKVRTSLSGLNITSVSDLVKYICSCFITGYRTDIEDNLKNVCSGFLDKPWHEGLEANPSEGVVSPELQDAVLAKGATLQARVKGKVLLPHLNNLDKDSFAAFH